jgi:anti-sigma regulatory factor (Ser/Thr protein kinase)
MAAPSLEAARPAILRLSFAPDPSSAREASLAVRNFLAEQGVAERELFPYELCAAEAVNNAVEYAVGRSRGLRPVAEVLLTAEHVEMRVTDHTPGFDLADRVAPPPMDGVRGRGLFLIQSIMDEVRYLRGSDENTLVMRKRLAAENSPDALSGRAARPRPAPAAPPSWHFTVVD